ncbi:MAG TPA: hypothetical protein VJ785_00590 [Anaerolineales bacterium]|nr:hypothetical protein [Anaerolineales bacterium]
MGELSVEVTVGAETCAGTAGAQLASIKISRENTTDKLETFLPINTASPFHEQDMIHLNARNYKTNFALCYNLVIMRYEKSDGSFLCTGVRGFDREGLLFTRLLPEDK